MDNPVEDPRFAAGLKMLERTGARATQIRWSDDEEPTVWFIVVEHLVDLATGRPVPKSGLTTVTRYETAAAMNPLTALLRLCEQIILGGTCAHCGKPAAFEESLAPTFLDEHLCWYAWDPELSTFRRSCEGETDG